MMIVKVCVYAVLKMRTNRNDQNSISKLEVWSKRIGSEKDVTVEGPCLAGW